MPTIGGKKAAILCLLEILRRYSDIDHPLSMHQLIQYLHKNYGISAERKSVSRNISLLLEMGMDISTYDENHKGYFLREREFDNLELRILIDSVMTSRYIPESDAKRLIHKLESLGSIYFRHQMRHVHSLPSWPHQHNKAFFFNLDLINEAIDLGQKISFTYNQYGTDGRLHPVRRNFIVSPYALIAANTLVKSWLIHAHAVTCGAVVGARVPIALTSRSANEEETYLSLVFCAVLDAWRKKQRGEG